MPLRIRLSRVLLLALTAATLLAVTLTVTVPALHGPEGATGDHLPAAQAATPSAQATTPAAQTATPEPMPRADLAALSPLFATTPAVRPCGAAPLGASYASAQALPVAPVHPFAGQTGGPASFAVTAFAFAGSGNAARLYVLDAQARTVYLYGIDGATVGSSGPGRLLSSFSVPWRIDGRSFAVDPDGNVYLAEYPYRLHRLSADGKDQWSHSFAAEIHAVYGVPASSGYRVGVGLVGRPGSVQLDSDGHQTGTSAIDGQLFSSDQASDTVVSTDDYQVRAFSGSGALKTLFGAPARAQAPLPFHFYVLGAAVVAPDRSIVVADAGRGLEWFGFDGIYRGLAGEGQVGALTETGALGIFNGALFYAAGGMFSGHQTISWIALDELRALFHAPRQSPSILGIGAGLLASAPANYYAAGQRPAVRVHLASWWTAHASDVTGVYSVQEHRAVLAGETPITHAFAIPHTAGAGGIDIPLALPPPAPGYYQVDAQLLQGGAVVGSECLYYSIGSPGEALDLAALPGTPDYGGPSPLRAISLASALGFPLARITIDWQQLLPDAQGGTGGCHQSAAPLRFTTYDGIFARAAQLAAQKGITLEVLVGQGSCIEKTLVTGGTWQARVTELVTHFKATIHNWEAWNEPNLTYGKARDYTTRVLIPFYQGVKAADPGARVVGGSVLTMNLPYWRAIGKAGGFAAMDVVGEHPYTGHNRSFEEQGLVGGFAAFHRLLAQFGAASKPIWVTEVGWWSGGPASFYAQADRVVRLLLLSHQAGIDLVSYFLLEGGYGDLSNSLIQYGGGQAPYFAKPAILALLTYRAQIADRPYIGMLDTGTPHTFAALFGAPAGDGTAPRQALALWTDGMAGQVRVTSDTAQPIVAVDSLGGRSALSPNGGSFAISVSSSPQYLLLPAASPPVVSAVESFGPDLAAAALGAHAAASSHAPHNPAAAAIDGIADAHGGMDWSEVPGWASAVGDAAPALTITLAHAERIDRVIVSSHSISSIVPGLRSYDVQARTPAGAWVDVAQVRGEFYHERDLLTFPALDATAIRVLCLRINAGGFAGGVPPWFWPLDRKDLTSPKTPWYGPAFIYEVEAFGPGQTPAIGATYLTAVGTSTCSPRCGPAS